MISEGLLNTIRLNAVRLTKPVRFIIFVKETGCALCTDMRELARAVKAEMGKLALETYDVAMDRDKTEQYGIQRVPAIVVEGEEGRRVTFYGLPETIVLEVLLDTIAAASKKRNRCSEHVLRALKRLTDSVKIQVFVSHDSRQCGPVAETAISLALESDHIETDIIVAKDFPELVKKYDITILPKTIFGKDLQVNGDVSESRFLEMIFQAEGARPGPDRRCLTCGNASPDVICSSCKIRIQAEALDHKLKIGKMKQAEMD
jgi:alkyl hydroperoxide reductase subunit AhpF